MSIQLGDVAKDKITGLIGVVVIDVKYLHGCRRLTLQPQALHEGKPIESSSFDEPQLELVLSAAQASTSDTGGDRPEPTRRPEGGAR